MESGDPGFGGEVPQWRVISPTRKQDCLWFGQQVGGELIHFLAPSTALPIRIKAILDPAVKGVIWFARLPDSMTGIGIAALVLAGALAMRHFRGQGVAGKANLGDFAAMLYVILQFATLLTSASYFNTLHFITPALTALCAYFSIRLLAPSAAVEVAVYRIAVVFGLLLAVADFVAWTSEAHVLDVFPRSDLAALHANLPLAGGPTQNDSIMLVLAIVPYALANWALERDRSLWFSWLSLGIAAALATLLALSFSRGIYLAFAVFGVAAFALMKRQGSMSLRLFASCGLMVGVPVIAAVMYLGVQKAVMETIGNRTMSEQRSTQGRIVTWRDSLHAIEKHPILGMGGYTDGLESLEWLRGSPDKEFTARTYNAPLEALLCSGLMGLLSYGIFLLYPIIRFARGSWVDAAGIRRVQACAFLAAGLIALIVRDMTYSSLVLDGRTMLVAWMAVALLQNFIAIPNKEMAGAFEQAA